MAEAPGHGFCELETQPDVDASYLMRREGRFQYPGGCFARSTNTTGPHYGHKPVTRVQQEASL